MVIGPLPMLYTLLVQWDQGKRPATSYLPIPPTTRLVTPGNTKAELSNGGLQDKHQPLVEVLDQAKRPTTQRWGVFVLGGDCHGGAEYGAVCRLSFIDASEVAVSTNDNRQPTPPFYKAHMKQPASGILHPT